MTARSEVKLRIKSGAEKYNNGHATNIKTQPNFQQVSKAMRTRSDWLAPKFWAAIGSNAPVSPKTGNKNNCSTRKATP